MNAAAVESMVAFQDSGGNFDQLWGNIEPAIDQTVRRRLKRRLVTGPGGTDDQAAIDDCKQQVAIKLLRLPASEGRGWFNPGHGRDRVDGLRGWLYRLASNEVETYCRQYRRHCGRVRLSLDDLKLNAGHPGGPAVKSILKNPFKFDFDRFEIRDLIADCVAALPEADRALYDLAFEAMLSQREIGQALGTPAGTVCRRLKRLIRTLAAALAAKGIDTAWVEG